MLFDSCFCVSPAKPGLQAVEYLWPFPNWLGSAQQGHRHQLNSREEFWSGPRAQQLHWGKTWTLHPNRGVGSEVWSLSGLWGCCQLGAVGLEGGELGLLGSLRLLPPASLYGRAEEGWEKRPCQGTGTCYEVQDDADVVGGWGLLQPFAEALPQHLKMRQKI